MNVQESSIAIPSKYQSIKKWRETHRRLEQMEQNLPNIEKVLIRRENWILLENGQNLLHLLQIVFTHKLYN